MQKILERIILIVVLIITQCFRIFCCWAITFALNKMFDYGFSFEIQIILALIINNLLIVYDTVKGVDRLMEINITRK
ncbi:MAG: hypothetical protein ACRC28_18590 [Clostridium sp.]|uniref:hypothetical protein n=1 Tax=Clostridium sp. TaxID=1506 RepID=UPI003F2DCA54